MKWKMIGVGLGATFLVFEFNQPLLKGEKPLKKKAVGCAGDYVTLIQGICFSGENRGGVIVKEDQVYYYSNDQDYFEEPYWMARETVRSKDLLHWEQ